MAVLCKPFGYTFGDNKLKKKKNQAKRDFCGLYGIIVFGQRVNFKNIQNQKNLKNGEV